MRAFLRPDTGPVIPHFWGHEQILQKNIGNAVDVNIGNAYSCIHALKGSAQRTADMASPQALSHYQAQASQAVDYAATAAALRAATNFMSVDDLQALITSVVFLANRLDTHTGLDGLDDVCELLEAAELKCSGVYFAGDEREAA